MVENWAVIITAIGGAGGLVTLIGVFIAPASKRIALQRRSADSVMFLSNGVTALGSWGDGLAAWVKRHEPDANTSSATVVLAQVRKNLDLMRPDYEAEAPDQTA